jgi:hypothetical protein
MLYSGAIIQPYYYTWKYRRPGKGVTKSFKRNQLCIRPGSGQQALSGNADGPGRGRRISYTLNWLKNVVLAHKLEQLPISCRCQNRICDPGHFLVVRENGEDRPCFIEIKTSKDDRISWRESYYQGLLNYSNLIGIPILVAWKWRSFDIWTLGRLKDFKQKFPEGT